MGSATRSILFGVLAACGDSSRDPSSPEQDATIPQDDASIDALVFPNATRRLLVSTVGDQAASLSVLYFDDTSLLGRIPVLSDVRGEIDCGVSFDRRYAAAKRTSDVSELAFVEHLDATMASTGDVLQGVQHNYDAIVATAHGSPIPACP